MPRLKLSSPAALCVLGIGVAAPALAQRSAEPALYSSATGAGARALGMGGAFIAVADDATAASWNPAGLCVLEKPEASVAGQPFASVDVAYGDMAYTYDSSRNGNSGIYWNRTTSHEVETLKGYPVSREGASFDFASITVPFRAGSVKLVPQVSYQRAIAMGLDYTYRRAWTEVTADTYATSTPNGDYTRSGGGDGSSLTDTRNSGGLDVLGASLGISFTPKLFLGAAVNVWRNGSDSESTITQTSATYKNVMSGNSTAFRTTSGYDAPRTTTEDFSGTNFQVGLLAKPTSWLSVGAVFKSGFDMDYEQAVNSTTTTRTVTASGTTEDQVETVSTSTTATRGKIAWPSSIGGGIAVMPRDFVTVSLDATLIRWSAATLEGETVSTSSQTQTRTTRVSGVASAPSTKTYPSEPRATAVDRTWPVAKSATGVEQPDALQLRFGVEYVVRNPGLLKLQVIPIRAGIYRDRDLQRSTDGGDVQQLGLTVGFGLAWSRLSLDFAFVHNQATRGDDYTSSSQSTATSGTWTYVTTTSYTGDYTGDTKIKANRLFVSSTFRF